MEREPFPSVLENTLDVFWSRTFSQAVRVRWSHSKWRALFQQPGEQVWLVNGYLNSIFLPSARPDVFAPVRAEYSRSISAWRRPFQRAYVRLALTWPASLIFSQATLTVCPGVPGAENILILAGNHKIRLVDVSRGQATAVLKHGFPGQFMENEIRARCQASKWGLPVPELVCVGDGHTWFVEKYIQGTPLNRLPDAGKMSSSRKAALDALRVLVEKTCRSVDAAAYVDSLRSTVEQAMEGVQVLDESRKMDLLALTRSLADACLAGNKETMLLSQTHGDFQPANILVEGRQVWLIDWEYSGERQSVFDLLTLACHTRHPHGLAGRLLQFEKGIAAFSDILPGNWPGMEFVTPASRRRCAGILLLEELQLRLRELSNSLFRSPGPGFIQLQQEIMQWLGQP